MNRRALLDKWPALSLSVHQIRVLVMAFTLLGGAIGLVSAGVVLHYQVRAAIEQYASSFDVNSRNAAARLASSQAMLQRARAAIDDLPLHAALPLRPSANASVVFRVPPVATDPATPDAVRPLADIIAFSWRQTGAAEGQDGNTWLVGQGDAPLYVIPQNPVLGRIKLSDAGWQKHFGDSMRRELGDPALVARLAAAPERTLLLTPAHDAFNNAPVLRIAALLQSPEHAPVVVGLDLPASQIAPADARFGDDFDLILQHGANWLPVKDTSPALRDLYTRLGQQQHGLAQQTQWQWVRGNGLDLNVLLVSPLGQPDWYAVARISASQIASDVRGGAMALALFALVLIAGLSGWLYWIDRTLLRPTEQQSQRVQESEALNRSIFQTAPVGLLVVARESGEVLEINALAQHYLSVGEACTDLIALSRERMRRQPETAVTEFETVLPDGGHGRVVTVRLIATLADAKPAKLITLHDTTAIRASETRMKSALAETARANRAKSEFLATMSHEIRTPLNGMLGGIELLGLTALDVQQRDRLGIIQRSAHALLGTINDVLDFSKIEAGEMTIHPTRCNLLELLEDVARSFEPAATAKRLALYLDIDPALPAEVDIDGGRVRQMLSNLLGNAIKFTARGRIRLSAMQEDQVLILRVIDSGPGIAPVDQARLFDPFVQADQSDTRRYDGTGLGLSICKRLAGLLGGKITLTSEPGLGACFSLYLPWTAVAAQSIAARPDLSGIRVHAALEHSGLYAETTRWLQACGAQCVGPDQDAVVQITDTAATTAPCGNPPVPQIVLSQNGPVLLDRHTQPVQCSSLAHLQLLTLVQQLAQSGDEGALPLAEPAALANVPTAALTGRVLLVEDHLINQTIMRQQLQSLGVAVDVVADGAAALRQIEQQQYDWVITDIQMPTMDGYELARRLRVQGVQLPLIAISACVLQDERQRCRDAGIDVYLSKPVNTTQLAEALQLFDPRRLQAPVEPQALPPGIEVETIEPGTMDTLVRAALLNDMQQLNVAYANADTSLWRSKLHALAGALAVLGYPVESSHCRDMEHKSVAAFSEFASDWDELQEMVADITGVPCPTAALV
ncbi:ATP-binding protein [Amantichitinum ursilacus]|uniref:Virulence sensor protein BvgS n=1 Tax=Amantichitinum ursilacus TaxID=857265 RepID=A0A0N0XKF8_9NEIS|nr:ATP-binding protein [Amantichitinum ursilacus]KPC54659.1 Sensor histidine kinase RcsC [Amantichitinum ursilacus]